MKKPSKFKVHHRNVANINVDEFLDSLPIHSSKGKADGSARSGTKTKAHTVSKKLIEDAALRDRSRTSDAGLPRQPGSATRTRVGSKAVNKKRDRPTAASEPTDFRANHPKTPKTPPASKKGAAPNIPVRVKKALQVSKSDHPKVPKNPKTPLPERVTIKPEQTVELPNGHKIEVAGLRDDFNTRYIMLREGGRSAITQHAMWHGGSGEASRALREQGLVIVGGIGPVQAAVAQIKRFSKMAIATKPGWLNSSFVLANGQMITPAGQPQPLRAFSPIAGILNSAGNLEGWKKHVAEPLGSHLLASFFMMMMFAAALLRFIRRADNIGFELSGEAGRGKSTLQSLIASAAGPAIGNGGSTYWLNMNKTMNALESVLPVYNDSAIILDEAGLMPGSARGDSRAASMRELAFRLSAGVVKHRFGETAGTRSRTVFMISTNRAIGSLLGAEHMDENNAILDRLITLPLLADRPYGIFDHCPSDYASTGAFADALKQGASDHYGHAMPAYLAQVVELASRKPAWLTSTIGKMTNDFVLRVGIDKNDGSQTRVAQAIGLVYVAGCLAKRTGVLPRNYRPFDAAKVALDLHRNHGRKPVTFDDRLRALMRHPDAIDLGKEDSSGIPIEQLNKCPVLLYSTRSGQRELLVTITHMRRVFPDWLQIRNDPDVLARLQKSNDRPTRDRRVGPNGTLRPVYCFDISDL